jgi:nitroimidazol reductase NimA-like FMN-containing flavoprotein (pyridoxamine 5'-phosphate oxidase superfamily)
MTPELEHDIRAVIYEGQDLTLATLRPDGWPQATTVSYASDGLAIYFGCSDRSQKAQNLARDDRISAVIDLPYRHWNEIRGLSVGGRAVRVTDPAEQARAGALFLKKFAGEIEQYVQGDGAGLAMFRIAPVVFALLDYRQGFGHHEVVAAA